MDRVPRGFHMFAVVAGSVAGLMVLVVAIRGLRRNARFVERIYTAATGGWTVFGVSIYQPALLGRFAPQGLLMHPMAVSAFGFGLLALGVYGAMLLIGHHE